MEISVRYIEHRLMVLAWCPSDAGVRVLSRWRSIHVVSLRVTFDLLQKIVK
jgi:hypothetical protein